MEPFSGRAAYLGPSESRKRSRPNDFHDTGHHVRRVCPDPSAESFIDELPTVSDVASPKWVQNRMARTSHALEKNLPGVQTNMKNTAIDWSALPDLTVSPYLPNPEFNIGVTNESIQPEVVSWSFSGRAGDFNTSTKSPPWNLEYQHAPFETHHTAFDNKPDTAEVAYNLDKNGSGSDNSCKFIFDDAINPAFQFPSQPASIDENNPLSSSTAHLMSETSCEFTSKFPSASSSAVTAVVPDCSESVGMLGSPCLALGCTTLAESLEYGAVSLEVNPDRSTADFDLCFGVIITTIVSSIDNAQGVDVVPVDVEIFGQFIKLTVQNTKKYAGMLNYPVLCVLLKDFSVRLSATLTSSESLLNEKSDNQKAKPGKNYVVRVVVYGIEKEKMVIADLLSDADLFLQHPTDAECGRHRRYVNPHYLLRPGTEMPGLEQLSLMSDARPSIQSEKSEEVDLARLSRILDCAEPEVSDAMVTTEPSPRLRSTLMSHQLTALAVMIERESRFGDDLKFPSLWIPVPDKGVSVNYRHIVTGTLESNPVPTYGGVLADEMGLGKTLSVLALVCSTLDVLNKQRLELCDSMQKSTLIIAPKSTITGWQTQISRHIHPGKLRSAIYHGSSRDKIATQFENYDIVMTTYETLRSDWAISGALYSGRWLRVILDEAHHIRNRSSKVFKAALKVQSMYRWCLTGTPIHNSLDDYGALLSFIGIYPFGEKSGFDYWIASPLKENRAGSFKLLKNLVRATCLRRTKASSTVCLNLEKIIEKTEQVQLHQEDQHLYDFFKKKTADIAAGIRRVDKDNLSPKSAGDENILSLMTFLRAICNHGMELLPSSALSAWESSDISQVDWKMMQASRIICIQCGQDCDDKQNRSSPPSLKVACDVDLCENCAMVKDEKPVHTKSSAKEESALLTMSSSKTPGSSANSARPSAKVLRLLHNLQEEQRGHVLETPKKSVVFSHSTMMLDLIEPALNSHGFRFQRIDGQTSLENRCDALRQFNEVPQCTIMLASIGSCGEGVDFTAANYVHLIEPQWNPMVEAQAVDRVHRKGQTRPVTVTRYLVPNSIEGYIQWVQAQKLKLINQSLNDFDTSDQESLEVERWEGATSTVSREMSVIIKEAACNAHIQQQGIAKGTANMRTTCRVFNKSIR